MNTLTADTSTARRTLRRRRLSLLTLVLTLATMLPANAASKDFSFDGCSWRSLADNVGSGVPYGTTVTVDRNGGCRYLDADTRYYVPGTGVPGSGAQTATKSCPTSSAAWSYRCDAPGLHHQSQSRASSWETGHWQTSGWWG